MFREFRRPIRACLWITYVKNYFSSYLLPIWILDEVLSTSKRETVGICSTYLHPHYYRPYKPFKHCFRPERIFNLYTPMLFFCFDRTDRNIAYTIKYWIIKYWILEHGLFDNLVSSEHVHSFQPTVGCGKLRVCPMTRTSYYCIYNAAIVVRTTISYNIFFFFFWFQPFFPCRHLTISKPGRRRIRGFRFFLDNKRKVRVNFAHKPFY